MLFKLLLILKKQNGNIFILLSNFLANSRINFQKRVKLHKIHGKEIQKNEWKKKSWKINEGKKGVKRNKKQV